MAPMPGMINSSVVLRENMHMFCIFFSAATLVENRYFENFFSG